MERLRERTSELEKHRKTKRIALPRASELLVSIHFHLKKYVRSRPGTRNVFFGGMNKVQFLHVSPVCVRGIELRETDVDRKDSHRDRSIANRVILFIPVEVVLGLKVL